MCRPPRRGPMYERRSTHHCGLYMGPEQHRRIPTKCRHHTVTAINKFSAECYKATAKKMGSSSVPVYTAVDRRNGRREWRKAGLTQASVWNNSIFSRNTCLAKHYRPTYCVEGKQSKQQEGSLVTRHCTLFLSLSAT